MKLLTPYDKLPSLCCLSNYFVIYSTFPRVLDGIGKKLSDRRYFCSAGRAKTGVPSCVVMCNPL